MTRRSVVSGSAVVVAIALYFTGVGVDSLPPVIRVLMCVAAVAISAWGADDGLKEILP